MQKGGYNLSDNRIMGLSYLYHTICGEGYESVQNSECVKTTNHIQTTGSSFQAYGCTGRTIAEQ